MSALENRIPPPVLVLLIGVVMWVIARNTAHWPADDGLRVSVAGAVSALGLLVGGFGIQAFRRAKTTIDPVNLQAASVLVTTGIFRFSRNPMYVGFTALLSAWGIWLGAPWALVGIVLFVLFIRRFQILPEERVMQTNFGSMYDEYRQRVRRWL